ncbi:MAG: MlaD family protein [Planctomycetota bacterium]|jgi:ABC-type transporter Mla subunit MlaD
MSTHRSPENIKAGLFVIGTLAVALSIIFTLGGVEDLFKSRHSYVVRYSITDGAKGLEPGSAVTLGGRSIGLVQKVDFSSDNGVPTFVDVTISVDSHVQFYSDTVGFLERPLLGSGATINFAAVRFDHNATQLPSGEIIQGALAAPDFLAQAGYGQEQVTQVQNVLARADDLSERIDLMVEDFTGRSQLWFDRVDSITSEVEQASIEVNEGVDEARDLLARFDQVVAENQPVIAEAITNFENAGDQLSSILTTFEDETLVVINDMFEQGRDGVADARGSLDRIDSLLVEQTPEVRKTLANARLASDQLRLTLGEVRRTPWRLLHRPDKKELDFELLYDATRAYASAVSDLRAASEALSTIDESGKAATADGQPVAELIQQLAEKFDKYNEAEQKFVQLLSQSSP